MMDHVGRIGGTIDRIFEVADAQKTTPGRAADELARSLFNGEGRKTANG
jgi:hypothetical protein